MAGGHRGVREDRLVSELPTRMDRFEPELWDRINAEQAAACDTVEPVLGLLRSLSGITHGFPVDQLTHALQTATRAERAGAVPTMVVACLCHDIGKAFSVDNHGAIAAELLRPFVADDIYHVVRAHQDFQGRYFNEHFGRDPDARLRHRHEPWYEQAARFADDWDQVSFDPAYPTEPLEHFEPLVRVVFGSADKRSTSDKRPTT